MALQSEAADVLKTPAISLIHEGCGPLLPAALPVLAGRRLAGLVAGGQSVPGDRYGWSMGILRRILGTEDPDVQVAGLSGQGTIVSLREGGPYVNQRPTITMELDVELPRRQSYRAKARQPVGRLVVGRLQPGATIPIRVDPEDLAKVSVDEPAMLGQSDAPVEQSR
jgi:hypothetical protein